MNIQLALDEQPWNVAVTIKLLCLAPSNVNGYLAAKIIGKGSLVQYVIVITRARGMYSIYCTEARGRLRPRAEVNKCHTSRVHAL